MKMLCLILPLLLVTPVLAEDRVSNLGAPPPLTASEKNRLNQIMSRVKDLRAGLLLGSTAPENEQEVKQLIAESMPLLDKAERRRLYEEARENPPVIRNMAEPLDPQQHDEQTRRIRDEIFLLFRKYEELEKRIGHPLNPTAPGEWEHLGLSFARFDDYFNELLKRGLHEKKAFHGDLLRRTLMVKGGCFLNASTAYHKAGYRPAALDCYSRGVEILHFNLGLASHENELLDLYETDSPWFNIDQAGNPWASPSSRQQTTSEVSRKLLSLYCPWGVPVYRYLRATGLDRGLDLSILKEYSTGGGPRPKLSEAQIPDIAPPHVKLDAEAVLGDGHRGKIVLQGKKKQLLWDWVQPRPEYSVWFISPAVFDIQPEEMLPLAFKAMKVLFSGPLDLVVDEAIGALLGMIQEGYKGTVVSTTSTLLVDGNNYGLETSFLLDGDDFNWLKLGKEGFKKLFEWAAKKEIEWLFDCVDPRHDLLGVPRTYDGSRIPPVIIRSEVFGFEKVGPYEYRRILRILRFYQLSLKDAALEDNYDLQQKLIEVLPALDACRETGARPGLFRKPWPRLQNFENEKKPLGSRMYVVDFTPKSQLFNIEVEEQTFERWTAGQEGDDGSSQAMVRIFRPGDTTEPVIETSLSERRIVLQLFDHAADHKGLLSQWANLRTAGGRDFDDPYEVETRAADCHLDSHRAETCPLLNQYDLRIEQGGKVCYRQPLYFVGKQGHPVTGKVDSHKEKPKVIEMTLRIIAPDLIKLKADRTDLLPVRCQVNLCSSLNASYSWTNPGTDGVHSFSEFESRISVIAKVSGLDLSEDWYRGTVSNGTATYRMWGQTCATRHSAYLQCEVPLSVGVTEFTVTVEGFPPVKLRARRSGDLPQAVADPAADKARLDQAYSLYAVNRNDTRARQAYAGACTRYADQMFRMENWTEARRWAGEAIQASASQAPASLHEIVYNASWRLGERDAMIDAFNRWFALEEGRGNRDALGKVALSALRRWTSLGGSPSQAGLLWARIKNCYARGGIPNLYYDGYPFEPGPGEEAGR